MITLVETREGSIDPHQLGASRIIQGLQDVVVLELERLLLGVSFQGLSGVANVGRDSCDAIHQLFAPLEG